MQAYSSEPGALLKVGSIKAIFLEIFRNRSERLSAYSTTLNSFLRNYVV